MIHTGSSRVGPPKGGIGVYDLVCLVACTKNIHAVLRGLIMGAACIFIVVVPRITITNPGFRKMQPSIDKTGI